MTFLKISSYSRQKKKKKCGDGNKSIREQVKGRVPRNADR